MMVFTPFLALLLLIMVFLSLSAWKLLFLIEIWQFLTLFYLKTLKI